MNFLRRYAISALVMSLAWATASLTGTATASATPSTGVQAVVLSQNTVDGVDYITREVTIAPGGSTGWHYHDPIVYGVIRAGTLTWASANCLVENIYPTGSAIAEQSGADHAHIGRNLGNEPLVLWVTYVAPTGTPAAVSVPDPGCGFA